MQQFERSLHFEKKVGWAVFNKHRRCAARILKYFMTTVRCVVENNKRCKDYNELVSQLKYILKRTEVFVEHVKAKPSF